MPESTKKCQVLMHDGKSCGRDLYDEDFCIFHSRRTNKDLKQFQGELFRLLDIKHKEDIYFTQFIFPEGVVFPNRVYQKCNFSEAIFLGDIDFSETAFEESLYLWCTSFKGFTKFINCKFKKDIYIHIPTFEAGVSFLDATFECTATFREANFRNGANFSESVFKQGVYFRGSDFKGAIHFVNTHFLRECNFADAVFHGETDFERSIFGDWVSFSDTTFIKDVNFLRATFKNTVYLNNTVFEEMVNLKHSVFENAMILGADKSESNIFMHEADFRSVVFSNPSKIRFKKIDLSKVRFLETDVRGIHFIDVNWNKEKGKGRYQVFDEVSPNPDNNKFDYELIAHLYRQLRANYEENLRYSEAGDFYIGEMEMRRKAETSFFKKLPIILYKAISNYGESYYRPLCWILTILLLFPIFFMIAGIQPVNHEQTTMTAEKIKDYPTSFWYSMSVFSFIREKKCTTINNWGDALFVTESILSPIMLAFLLLALRRRFKR
jgi:uncharacterized protein YjbI with pentapeptide repeats